MSGARAFVRALASAAVAFGCGAAEHVRPNVLLIVVDTLRYDRVGSYGADRDTTPALDHLAREGIRFERAYATAPWTKPSVASMFTGLYPSAHGGGSVQMPLPDSLEMLAEMLAAEGFATAGVVSHFIISHRSGFAQGFEEYLEDEARGHDYVSTEGVVSQATRILERFAHGDRPFLLFVHLFDPHYNYVGHPDVGFAAERTGRLDGTQRIGELRRMELTDEEISHLRDLYDEEVRHTDAGIGLLLERLEALGLADETLVVATADHGEEFLEHGWLGHTRNLYEELVRVPLILRLPGRAQAGRVVGQPVSLVSLAPTILDLVGIDATSRGFHGHSLAGLVRGEPAGEAALLAEVDFVPPFERAKRAFKKALVTDRYKLIRDDETGAVQLFDLEEDTPERRDLASERPDVARGLLDVLERRLDRVRADAHATAAIEPLQLSPEEIERLRQLGYAGP